MGGGKETPRQKMVGLMYLVLMALLAMNVSKEVIEAFVTLDTKIHNGVVISDAKNDNIVGTFGNKLATLEAEKASEEEKNNLRKWQQKSLNIRKLTNDISNFMVKEAADMISFVEKYPTGDGSWMVEDEGRTTFPDEPNRKWYKLRPISEIQAKDNYDAATNLFIGETMFKPVKRGIDISEKIFAYRDSLCIMMANYEGNKGVQYSFTPPAIRPDLPGEFDEVDAALEEAFKTVNPEDIDRIRSVFKILTLPVHQMNHGQKYPWIAAQFDHAPVVAAAAIFTSLKADIMNAETIALEFMASKVQVQMFNFNKIEPLSFSRSSYINMGDSVGIKVMIAAYDSSKVMELRYWEGDETRNVSGMKEVTASPGSPIKFKGTKVGPQTIYGQVGVEVKGSLEWKDWEYTYTVGEPTGVVALPEMNVLYRGYDNKVTGSASGFPEFKLVAGANVTLTKSGKDFIAKPGEGREATISVQGIAEDGTTAKLGDYKFRVMGMPKPSIYLGSIEDGADAPAASIKAQTKLFAKYGPEIPLLADFNITSWEINVTGAPRPASGSGSTLSGDALNLIKQARAGNTITIMCTVVGPDKKPRKSGASFKVK